MINSIHLIFTLLLCCTSINVNAQIFGNTANTGYGGYGQNQIVWLKIITGASDSGVFTHYGLYDHPTQGLTCEVKYALYDDHPTSDKPNNLLSDDYEASPTNGQWNEEVMDPQVIIEPNTTYWIGLRFNCNYGSGREIGVNWANQPLKFKESWSFFSSWPDPSGSLSTYGRANNVGLYMVGNNQTLPIELVSFEVLINKSKVILSWATVFELDNSGWNVQRSNNGFSWKNIDWVDGQGDSNKEESYFYEESLTKDGLAFYRLEQVDFDGSKSYSEVKMVDFIINQLIISPNPASDFIEINGVKDDTPYSIHGAQGNHIMNGVISRREQLDISSLSSGIYFVTILGQPYRIVKV